MNYFASCFSGKLGRRSNNRVQPVLRHFVKASAVVSAPVVEKQDQMAAPQTVYRKVSVILLFCLERGSAGPGASDVVVALQP